MKFTKIQKTHKEAAAAAFYFLSSQSFDTENTQNRTVPVVVQREIKEFPTCLMLYTFMLYFLIIQMLSIFEYFFGFVFV